MNKIFSLIKENPRLLSKYVTASITVLNLAVKPFNTVLKHLLEIQDIDPKSNPGSKTIELLTKALDTGIDTEDFNPNFDFAVLRGFDNVSRNLPHLNITQEDYKKIVNLNYVYHEETENRPQIYSTRKPSVKRSEADSVPNTVNDVQPEDLLQKMLDKNMLDQSDAAKKAQLVEISKWSPAARVDMNRVLDKYDVDYVVEENVKK